MKLSMTDVTSDRSVGAMIVEESFGLDQGRFIRAACPHRDFPQFVLAEWREPAKRPPALAPEIPFLHCAARFEQWVVHLLGFPEALSRVFSLDDLKFPLELRQMGFVVVLDIEALSRLKKEHLPAKSGDPRRSAYAWALAHSLPLVVVAKGCASAEELRPIVELSAGTPVCYCSDFDAELIQDVLKRLIQQFGEARSS